MNKFRNVNTFCSHWFLLALCLLLLNDFVLKTYFANAFTGKLSDFAGLFVFVLFWSSLFPSRKLLIYVGTGLFFIYWKSPYSQGIINLWNQIGLFGIARVVDYTDLMALLVLPFAYMLELRREKLKTIKLNPVIPILISAFAFGATSYQRNFSYDKTYYFTYPKQELVDKLNIISTEYDNTIAYPLSLNHSNANNFRLEHNDTLWYYVSDTSYSYDTVFKKNTMDIDTIYTRTYHKRDTIYINQNGIFYFKIPVRAYMKESKTGYCEYVDVKLSIREDDGKASLTLNEIFTGNCMGMFEKEAEKNEEKNLQKAFEAEIIRKLLE